MRDVNNHFSNTVKFVKELGPSLLAATEKSKIPEYLPDNIKGAVKNISKFTGDVGQQVKDGTYTTFWGNQSYKSGTPFSSASGTVADVIGNTVTSDKFRQQYVWPYTNAFRVVSKAGAAAANLTGLEDPMAKAAVVAGIPLFIHTMTETSGPITQGLRPKGYKAVAPVSKEEDLSLIHI